MNPIAIVFWIVCGLVGWLVNDLRGAVIGLVISMSLSIVAGAIPSKRR